MTPTAPPDDPNPRPIYLDYHATTPTDPRVVAAMLPYFAEQFGNPSSLNHPHGREAATAVDAARAQVAALVGADPREVVFTSGATEANNLAIKGLIAAARTRERVPHVVSSTIEHPSVLAPLRRLARERTITLTLVPPRPDGTTDPSAVTAALNDKTLLVTILAAHNEVGSINDLAALSDLCRSRGIAFHTDASQAIGKIPLDFTALGLDLLSLTAHKFCGPKGVGALILRRSDPNPPRLLPLFDGGGHEHGLRSGTLPVPLLVGLGAACSLAQSERETESLRVSSLRNHLWTSLRSRFPDLLLNGPPDFSRRLSGNLHVTLPGLDADGLLMRLRSVSLSTGSACSTTHPGPSPTLLALGLSEESATASLRFGLGRFTTRTEVDQATDLIARATESRFAHRLERAEASRKIP